MVFVTVEKLQEILAKHQLWLNNEDGGVRANLSGADLSGAKGLISTVNYMEAHFERTDEGYIAYKTFGGQYQPQTANVETIVLMLPKAKN